MLDVSCSQNHIPATRSGHLQGKKPQNSDLASLYLTLMYINHNKVAFWSNRPDESSKFQLTHPSSNSPKSNLSANERSEIVYLL